MKEILDILTHNISCYARKKVNKQIVRNSFLFIVSSLIGLRRIKYIYNNKEKYPNFFGITLAPSGFGKDLSLNAIEALFKDPFDFYTKIAKENMNIIQNTEEDNFDEKNYIIPNEWKVALAGSIEGMMRVANFYDLSSKGSLNVVSTEFGSELSHHTLPLLTKLWQDAKAEGSTNVNEKYPPVNNVFTNILLFGSSAPFQRNQYKHNQLVEAIESGLARRTFFVMIDKEPIEIFKEKPHEEIFDYTIELKEHIRNLENIEWEPTAVELLEDYRIQLINEYNQKMTNWNAIRTSNIEKIERLSVIIAIIGLKSNVDEFSVKEAIDISIESDKALEGVLRPKMPYIQMYELLEVEPRLSISEMIELGVMVKGKKEAEEQVQLLEELAYRKSKKLIKKGSFYSLEDLPLTDLNKIIVSVNGERKGAKGTYAQPFVVPFFGEEGTSIERLVQSNSIDWFSFVHFKDNKRNSKNAIEGQNIIAFDIDEGTSLEEALELLVPYTYLVYTTKSHQKEKNGVICDRFRIILPTKYKFFVDNERHKETIANVAKLLGLNVIDDSTRNIDRLWFPNPDAIIYKNQAELLDISCCIADTEKEEIVMQQVGSIDETKYSEDKRIKGMQKWVVMNSAVGNRNNNLFKFKKFLEDLGLDNESVCSLVLGTNAMLSNPLDELEIEKTICRR